MPMEVAVTPMMSKESQWSRTRGHNKANYFWQQWTSSKVILSIFYFSKPYDSEGGHDGEKVVIKSLMLIQLQHARSVIKISKWPPVRWTTSFFLCHTVLIFRPTIPGSLSLDSMAVHLSHAFTTNCKGILLWHLFQPRQSVPGLPHIASAGFASSFDKHT